MSDIQCPPFLKELLPSTQGSPFRNAIFEHPSIGSAHALWWPTVDNSSPHTVLLFIPGNPGLLGFYTPFLTELHGLDKTHKLAILAHSHIGHTPCVSGSTKDTSSAFTLIAQVQGAIEAFDALVSAYSKEGTRFIIVGHSVGAWISLQVLKQRATSISAVFLLFPTISHIRDTPNGRKLFWLFRPPIRSFISSLSYLARTMPTSLLSFLFPDWPIPQILILKTLICSSSSIEAALTMAHDEMSCIRELDLALLNVHKHRMWFYYAEHDDWVGNQKEYLQHTLHPDDGSLRIVHGEQDIPHAFCINHGRQLAQHCHQWLISF